MYGSETEGPRRRGRLVVRWKDRVKDYMHKRDADRRRGIEQTRSEYMDWERRWLYCQGHSLVG